MEATPIAELMLFDLMEVYKFAGDNDAPYGQGRLRGQKIAYADQLTRQDAREATAAVTRDSTANVGTATAFFSHPWNMRAREFFEVCVAAFGPEDFVWIDLYLHNQFSGTLGSEFWIGRFSNLVERIGKVVAVMTPWNDPVPLRRIWCLFELVCAIQGKDKGVALELILAEEQKRNLIRAVRRESSQAVMNMLVEVKIANAEATVPEDKTLIWAEVMKLPQQDHGCDVHIKILLREWVFQTLRQAVIDADPGAEADDSELAEFAALMHQVARVFDEHGMLDEALALYERALQIKETALGPDHPSTADTRYNMALLFKQQDMNAKAKELFLLCAASYEKFYGADHSETTDAVRQASRC